MGPVSNLWLKHNMLTTKSTNMIRVYLCKSVAKNKKRMDIKSVAKPENHFNQIIKI